MALDALRIDAFAVNAHALWKNQWLALACGDFASGRFNAMTVAWGSIGTMWEKPFVQIVVRPTRYTFTFLERFDTFTLCAFPDRFRKALSLLGSKSGRDCDKIKESGLTPIASETVASPSFLEAELALECRKVYWADLEPAHFLDPKIRELYPRNDYHRVYFGEVLRIRAEAGYRSKA
jgi:flavin reductase (DIM6/NTAB) family NADH-FMN oxidoreductase RutF